MLDENLFSLTVSAAHDGGIAFNENARAGSSEEPLYVARPVQEVRFDSASIETTLINVQAGDSGGGALSSFLPKLSEFDTSRTRPPRRRLAWQPYRRSRLLQRYRQRLPADRGGAPVSQNV